METSGTTVGSGAPVRLSARAVEAVKRSLTSQNLAGHTLRVGLVPGGCAGFSYDLDVVPAPKQGDVRFEQDGIAIAVDPESVAHLSGTEIDFVEDGLKSGFAFKNPNARSSCGCGSSFKA